MLYLRTGLPGAGKTLNAIREIDLEHQPTRTTRQFGYIKTQTTQTLRPGRSITTESPTSSWIAFALNGWNSKRQKSGLNCLMAP